MNSEDRGWVVVGPPGRERAKGAGGAGGAAWTDMRSCSFPRVWP